MTPFFQVNVDNADDEYINTRDIGRENIEQWWSQYRPYLEDDLPVRALKQFHHCFWEIYLAAALHEMGLILVPRVDRPTEGPDFCIKSSPSVWVEAIAATAGTGPDAVEEHFGKGTRQLPDDGIRLRLLSALKSKSDGYDTYLTNGVIQGDEPYVIAINGARVPSARWEMPIPRIAMALFEFGNLYAIFSTKDSSFVDEGYRHKPSIQKKSGTEISTGFFLNPASAGISAVLYSASDACKQPKRPGSEFVVVHNPCARNPLPLGWFGICDEFYKDGDMLECREPENG